MPCSRFSVCMPGAQCLMGIDNTGVHSSWHPAIDAVMLACRLSSLYAETKHTSSPILPRAAHAEAAASSTPANSPFAAAAVQQTPMVCASPMPSICGSRHPVLCTSPAASACAVLDSAGVLLMPGLAGDTACVPCTGSCISPSTARRPQGTQCWQWGQRPGTPVSPHGQSPHQRRASRPGVPPGQVWGGGHICFPPGPLAPPHGQSWQWGGRQGPRRATDGPRWQWGRRHRAPRNQDGAGWERGRRCAAARHPQGAGQPSPAQQRLGVHRPGPPGPQTPGGPGHQQEQLRRTPQVQPLLARMVVTCDAARGSWGLACSRPPAGYGQPWSRGGRVAECRACTTV